MTQISFENNIKFLPKIPVSIQGILKLPSFSFNINTFILGNEWEDAINDWIFITYIGMIVSGKIRINYDNDHKNKFEDFFGFNPRHFAPSIQHVDFDVEIETYLENKIFTSIEEVISNEGINSEAIFKQHIENLVYSIIGKSGDFVNPWKIIAERLIKNENSGYWTFRENKKFFGLITKLEVSIEEDYKKILMTELRKTEHMIKILNKDELFETFTSFLRKKISRAIRKRQDLSD